MKSIRQFHLYLGCFFAPLIIYFSLSGAWQVFRFNDLPKNEPTSTLRSVFHEISKPHTSSTLPGFNPKVEHSAAFNWLACFMGFGMVTTSSLGIVLAVRSGRSRQTAWICLIAGVVAPVLLLLIR
jgi:predicted permease